MLCQHADFISMHRSQGCGFLRAQLLHGLQLSRGAGRIVFLAVSSAEGWAQSEGSRPPLHLPTRQATPRLGYGAEKANGATGSLWPPAPSGRTWRKSGRLAGGPNPSNGLPDSCWPDRASWAEGKAVSEDPGGAKRSGMLGRSLKEGIPGGEDSQQSSSGRPDVPPMNGKGKVPSGGAGSGSEEGPVPGSSDVANQRLPSFPQEPGERVAATKSKDGDRADAVSINRGPTSLSREPRERFNTAESKDVGADARESRVGENPASSFAQEAREVLSALSRYRPVGPNERCAWLQISTLEHTSDITLQPLQSHFALS